MFAGFAETPFRPLSTPAQRRLFQCMLSLWVDSCDDGDEGCGDEFIAPCPLWRMFSPHLQWSLVADVARWCLCDGESAPAKLSLPHKAALWALYFNFEGRGLRVEIDLQDEIKRFSYPVPVSPTPPSQSGTSSLMTLSESYMRDMLRHTAALVEAEGGDLAGAGLSVLPEAAPSAGRPMRDLACPSKFFQLLWRVLPHPQAGEVAVRPLPSSENRYRRLLLEAWLEHIAEGSLVALGLPTRLFIGPSGEKRHPLISYADMTAEDCSVVLPLVTVRAINGLVDSDEGLLLGYLRETNTHRIRTLVAIAQDANATFEASWDKDKSCTSRAAAVVQLLSRAGSFWGEDVNPETEREGEAANGAPKRTAVDVLTNAAHFRRALVEFSQRSVCATERPVWECASGGGRVLPSGVGPTAADVAAFSACGETFGESLSMGVAATLSERKLHRMMGEYHAAMEAMHGSAESNAVPGPDTLLARAYDTPYLRLAAIRSIAHPAASVHLDVLSPLETRRAAKQSLLSEINSCSHCKVERAAGELSACAACKVARYCGRACQKAAWPAHKHVCAGLQAAVPAAK